MAWQLNTVTADNGREWRQDKSGMYTQIAYTSDKMIRVDIFNVNNDPMESFQAKTEDADFLRRAVLDFMENIAWHCLSQEHSSYIGSEIIRACFEKSKYIQN